MHKEGVFSRTIRHTKRYQEIVAVLFKYGMGDIVRSIKITDALPFLKRVVPKNMNAEPISDFSRWEEIRMAIEELGPTFVKLGQMLSNRPDIIPEALCKELEKLQDDVLAFDGETAVQIIETELQDSIDNLFLEFNMVPVASASIGQVHDAELPDGTRVAVKVQRPDIEETVRVDIEILYNIAGLAEKNIEGLQYFSPTGIIREFEQHIKEEMDYNRERRNAARFAKIFEKDHGICSPKTYKSHSTKRVLTMEFIDGVKISHISEEDLPGFDRGLIARRGAMAMLRQMFLFGFFHADPHPGNIMVLDDNVVCFIDFGMMGTIMPEQQDMMNSLLLAVQRKDSAMVTNIILDFTHMPDHPQKREISYEVNQLISNYVDIPLNEISIEEVFESVTKLISRFKLHIPSNLILLFKAIAMIEGIGRQIAPSFEISSLIDEFAPAIQRHRYSPKRIWSELIATGFEYKSLFASLPESIRVIAGKMKAGNMKIEIEHKGLEPLRNTIDGASYRLLFGLVLAALIIGSSIMVHVQKSDIIHTVGVIGFIIGAAFAMVLLVVALVQTFRQ